MDPAPTSPAQSLPRWKLILQLMYTFGKLGAFTFGGGYAMIALLEEELVIRKKWLTSEDALNVITIAESTPGPIAVNMATFVGARVAGVLGGVLATVALVFPAWLCIVLLSIGYDKMSNNTWVASALAGIRIAAVVLIAKAFLRMGKNVKRSLANILAFSITLVLALAFNLSAIALVLLGLAYGVVWFGVLRRGSEAVAQ